MFGYPLQGKEVSLFNKRNMISSIREVCGNMLSQLPGVNIAAHQEKKILCVGLACLDIIQVCESFPKEDSDQRCVSMRWQRGGNSSNNCTVLSQLGAPCEFFGTLSKKQHVSFMIEDFKANGICIENCVYYDDCEAPTSVAIINLYNGSRTIIHSNKNLPELTLEDFKKLDLNQYSWIHFEGRNVSEVVSMIEWVDFWNERNFTESSENNVLGGKGVPISVELEKPRAELQDLIPVADVLFVGKDFAEFRGCTNMSETLKNVAEEAKPNAIVISAWGERGAMAQGPDGNIVQSPAFPPPKAVDTLGAGDTFCAATIFGLSRGYSLQESIILGCQIAGAKVGMDGFDGIKLAFERFKKKPKVWDKILSVE